MAEDYVQSTYLQKWRVASAIRRIRLVLSNMLVMTENLGRCSDEGDQVVKLSTEFLDAQVVNVKEIVGLGLLGKTGSGKSEFR